MFNHYKVITLNHHQSSLYELQHLIIDTEAEGGLRQALTDLKAGMRLRELMYVQTCNRVLYLFDSDQKIDSGFIRRFILSVNPGISAEGMQHITGKIVVYEGEKAINHLLEVTASIDSLVVGEREIIRQVRQAWEQSFEWGLAGDNIRLLIKVAIETAKQVYTDTKIGEKPLSVASLVFEKLLENHIPRDANVWLVGAGQTNLLISKILIKNKYNNVRVFNRSVENAGKIATLFGKAGESLDTLYGATGFDVMIFATGSTQPLMDRIKLEKIMDKDTSPKYLLDLCVPANVDRDAMQLDNVRYIDIEAIRTVADSNLEFRKSEVDKARAIIRKAIESFYPLYHQRQVEKAFRYIPEEIKAVKENAIENVFRKELSEMEDCHKQVFLRMLDYMEKRCIGIPMKAAKDIAISR